ncbi:MAG: Cof-type HAD-IIB family hydrolase [Lachnospiraceae bacterium]|jgi:Cof subfamily protein (haloacid dehalogenase superfamily)|nr:Cof-type HAD-IIB family hydrolase [Lachnospiraceae bacterium]
MIKLIGLDLDGTVFDNQKNISERTKNAVGQAAARGVFVVPMTGRPYRAIPESVLKLDGVRYLAAVSGAAVYDLQEGIKIHEDLIANARASEVLRRLQRVNCVTMAFIDGFGYVEHENLKKAIEYAETEVIRHYLRTTRTGVDDLPSFIEKDGRGVEKFTVNFPHGKDGHLIGLEKVLDLLSDCRKDMDLVYGGAINLEVTNRTATKGNALHFLAEKFGIAKEEIMACGDSGNDLEMLQASGLPVAMANAEENIKKAASFITKSNEEDGVAAAIEKFVLGD